jgi:paraquat-inducible protein A
MQTTDQSHGLFVCHECDALQNISGIKLGNVASCVCCGSTLFRNPKEGFERPLAFLFASAILFLVANIYPIMEITIAGIERSATLTDSAMIFLVLGDPLLAAAVWVPGVLLPGLIMFGLLYVLSSIRFNMNWPYTKPILVLASRFIPFGMMDVFLLGVLVALVKLVALADVLLGPGFYAFVALIIVYAGAMSSFEPHLLWERLDKNSDDQLKQDRL